MAKEIAIGKRAKISEAQQYMILAVLGASLFLGAAISLVSNFIKQISFNTDVIMAEEASIKSYSDYIKTAGICKSPKNGDTYSSEELDECNPSDIDISEISGTLRANILENLAANEALNSVPKEDSSRCLNSDGKKLTYKDLIQNYKDAKGTEELVAASQLIKSCSALRIIPDALPAFKNEEALLASLNKIFNISDWKPESISPSGDASKVSGSDSLNAITVNLSVETDTGTTMRVLNNIERSIRDFNFKRATIEWGGDTALVLRAQAEAYYLNPSTIKESAKTFKVGDKK